MFRNLNIFTKKCLVCNNKNLYKYEICKDCYELLDFSKTYIEDFKYLDEIYICLNYNEFLKELVWKYKYQDKNYFYKFFAEVFIEKIFKNNLNKTYNILTYIPMHEIALKKRGYNQSKLIAEYINKNTLMNIEDLLYKNRNNKGQAYLSKKDRYENVKDIFETKRSFENENILIVDDIVTTGYTLDFAAKSLKEKGAKKVAAIVAATHENP